MGWMKDSNAIPPPEICVRACVCEDLYEWVCVYICTYIHRHTHTYTRICVCVYVEYPNDVKFNIYV